MFLCFVMCLTWLVLAVFAMAISKLFTLYPSSVLPVNIEIIIAIIMGYVIYKKKISSFIPSIIALCLLYVFVYLGTLYPISLNVSNPQNIWIILLFIYSGIASMLPVWLLLQPRDYINSHQLLVGLGMIYMSIFIFRPEITAPALNLSSDGPPIIPFLFVTIACGALSGFHGIVSSGTSAKQLDNEKDARFVGYLGALGEGSLALITITAVTGSLYASSVAGGWDAIYPSFTGGPSAGGFIAGGALLISEGWGIPLAFAQTMLAVMVVLFAGTTMDAGLRLTRYIIQEWGNIYQISPLKNNYISTLVAVAACLLLAFGVSNGNYPGDGGTLIWPVFGATNQILASMTLIVLAVYLLKLGRSAKPLIIPMCFILFMASWAGVWYIADYISRGQWILVVIQVAVMGLALFIILEAWSTVTKLKQAEDSQEEPDSAPSSND